MNKIIDMKQFQNDLNEIIKLSRNNLLYVYCMMYDMILFQRIIKVENVNREDNKISLITDDLFGGILEDGVNIILRDIENYEYGIAKESNENAEYKSISIRYNNGVTLTICENFL